MTPQQLLPQLKTSQKGRQGETQSDLRSAKHLADLIGTLHRAMQGKFDNSTYFLSDLALTRRAEFTVLSFGIIIRGSIQHTQNFVFILRSFLVL